MSYLNKLKGDGAALAAKPSFKIAATASLGAFIAMAVVASLGEFSRYAVLFASLGGSCVLAFGYPDAPFSQPRSIIGGHVISAIIGLGCLTVLGDAWWSMAIAVGLSVGAMMLSRTVHPPGGANPVAIFMVQPSWGFVLFPVLVGAIVVVLIAVLYNNATREAKYPKYWF